MGTTGSGEVAITENEYEALASSIDLLASLVETEENSCALIDNYVDLESTSSSTNAR